MKRVLRKVFGRVGYEIVPKRMLARERNAFSSRTYRAVLLALHAAKGRLNLVVVGANDGRMNDPAYPLVAGRLKESSRVILFEPQPCLIPYLEENYAAHPDHHVINAAVGAEGEMELFAIRPDDWPRMQPDYAKGWPIYRAPTGVTSGDRNHVLRFARRFLDTDEAEAAIESSRVPRISLKAALDARRIAPEIDAVQVDTEGFDDEVLFNCDLETLRPDVIFFERSGLPPPRRATLDRFLQDLNYEIVHASLDALCIRRGL